MRAQENLRPAASQDWPIPGSSLTLRDYEVGHSVIIQLVDGQMAGSRWDLMVADVELAVARHADDANLSVQFAASFGPRSTLAEKAIAMRSVEVH
jgi:hypothetical protein